MLALSIRQPWAWLIIHAGKDIENRTWATHYRGPILIHAAKGMTREEYDAACDTARFVNSVIVVPPFNELQRGGFIGSADLADCVSTSESRWFFGPFGFVLRKPRPREFTPYKGQLGFFEVSDNDTETGLSPDRVNNLPSAGQASLF